MCTSIALSEYFKGFKSEISFIMIISSPDGTRASAWAVLRWAPILFPYNFPDDFWNITWEVYSNLVTFHAMLKAGICFFFFICNSIWCDHYPNYYQNYSNTSVQIRQSTSNENISFLDLQEFLFFFQKFYDYVWLFRSDERGHHNSKEWTLYFMLCV